MSNNTSSPASPRKTQMLAVSGMLLAVSSVLSIYPKFSGFWPSGGSVTVMSMLPIVLIAYLYGTRWGLLAGLTFGLIQLLTGLRGIAGMDFASTVLVILIDYLAAFTVLGFGGVFRGKFRGAGADLAAGSVLALSLRFLCHFISGALLFGSYAEWFFGQEGFTFGQTVLQNFSGLSLTLIYSLCYNISYMLPEIIITAIGAAVIGKVFQGRMSTLTR